MLYLLPLALLLAFMFPVCLKLLMDQACKYINQSPQETYEPKPFKDLPSHKRHELVDQLVVDIEKSLKRNEGIP